MYPEYRLQNLYCLCVIHVCTWPENCGDVSCLWPENCGDVRVMPVCTWSENCGDVSCMCAPDQKTVEMSHACMHLTRKLWRCVMPACTYQRTVEMSHACVHLTRKLCRCLMHVCTWPENCGDVSCLRAPDQKTVEMSHACVHLTRKLCRCLMHVCTWPENCGDVSCLHAPDWRGSLNTKYHSTWIRPKMQTKSLTCPSCSRTWRSRTGWPLCRHRRAWAGTCPWWWRNSLSPTSPLSASASLTLPAHPNVSQLKFFPTALQAN